MTYIDYLNRFNQWLKSNYLPGNARLLYYSMLSVFNEAGWPAFIQVDNLRLMFMVDTKTERVAISARDSLVGSGFIVYSKGKKRNPNKYRLTNFTIQKVSECDSVSDSECDSVSGSVSVQKTVSHIKTKKKNKITPYPLSEEFGFGEELNAVFSEWLTYKQEKRQGYKPTGLKSLAAQVRKQAGQHGEPAVAALIRECMACNWQGIIWDRLGQAQEAAEPYRAPRPVKTQVIDGEEVVIFDR